MGYFELLCQGCNGIVAPFGPPDELHVVDPANPYFGVPGYATPSDTTGDGTLAAPFATFQRALDESGRIVDKALSIRLHNRAFDWAAPAARGVLTDKTTESGEWDVNPIGGRGKLFIVGDLCVGQDKVTLARGEGGSAIAPGVLIDKTGMIEGAMTLDVLDGAPGWGGNLYTPNDDSSLIGSYLEWTETMGPFSGKYRAKILAIDNFSVPGTTKFFLQLPPGGSQLPTMLADPGSISVVLPGYGFANAVPAITVMRLYGTRTGRGSYVPAGPMASDFWNMPNIVLHGLTVTNTTMAPNCLAMTGGNYLHGMLTLRAYSHVLIDSIGSVDSFKNFLPSVDDFDLCGGTLFLVISDAKGMIYAAELRGGVNLAVLAAPGSQNRIIFTNDCDVEVMNLNVVTTVGASGNVHELTGIEGRARVNMTGSCCLGRKVVVRDDGRLSYRGWSDAMIATGMALAGPSLGGNGRVEAVEDGKISIDAGWFHLDQPVLLGRDLQPGGGITEDALVWIDGSSSEIHVTDGSEMEATAMNQRPPYVGANVIGKPALVCKNKFVNEGGVRFSGVAPGIGDDFGLAAAIQVLRGAELISHGGLLRVFEIQNENVGPGLDIIAIVERSVAGFDGSTGTTVLNGPGAVPGTAFIGSQSGKTILMAGGVTNEFTPAGALTGNEDTSMIKIV